MRVLLDECVPPRLRGDLSGHEFRTVSEMRWRGKRNGELLRLMLAEGFDVLLTTDRNIPHQQNIRKAGVAVLLLVGKGNRRLDLIPLVPAALSALDAIQPGEVVEIGP